MSFYTCGPTVYAEAHIGNLRTFVASDFIRRTLEYLDYDVRQVINITDVDDKTIGASRAAGKSLASFTTLYEELFLADMASLNIRRPAALPHATAFIPQMITMINSLLELGIGYRQDDGIYFKLSRFSNYGRLRISAGATTAEVENDFVLWKFYKDSDGEVGWDAPFGRGRPGWHIECSAMIAATLGEEIDLHLGGEDLSFPHHENENAQSESLTGKPLACFWLHSALVIIEKEKMAKSLGNILTLRNLEDNAYTPLDFRYLLLTVHYRSPLNFTWQGLVAAKRAYDKLKGQAREWAEAAGEGKIIESYRVKFKEALADDFNLPQALALVWKLIKDDREKRRDKLATIIDFDRVLGLNLGANLTPLDSSVPSEIADLAKARDEARHAKNWAEADRLRGKVKEAGYIIHDTPSGPKLSPIHR